MSRFILMSFFLFGCCGALIADDPQPPKAQEAALLGRSGRVRLRPVDVYIVGGRLIVRAKEGFVEVKAIREGRHGIYYCRKDTVIRGVGHKNYYKHPNKKKRLVATKGHHHTTTPRSPIVYSTPDGGIDFYDDPVVPGHPEHRYGPAYDYPGWGS